MTTGIWIRRHSTNTNNGWNAEVCFFYLKGKAEKLQINFSLARMYEEKQSAVSQTEALPDNKEKASLSRGGGGERGLDHRVAGLQKHRLKLRGPTSSCNPAVLLGSSALTHHFLLLLKLLSKISFQP